MKHFLRLQNVRNTFLRFLLTGGLNTLVTYGMYLLLIQIFNYGVSYSVAFVFGIILSYVLNCVYVFRTTGSLSSMTLFPLIYLFQFLIGLGVVVLWVEMLGWDKRFAPLASIACTIPLTYWLSRWLFTRKQHAAR